MKKQLWIKGLLAVGSIVHCSGADIIWPSDIDWHALTRGTDFYHDPAGDESPAARDLTGTTDTFSMGYWALIDDGHVDGGVTNDAFTFRLRLADNGESGKFIWQVSLDIDGDASDVEWMLQLVQTGKSKNHGVELIQIADGGPNLDDVDIGSNKAAWLGNTSLYSRWTSIPDSTDYYVDIAVPWTTFTSITGVTELEQIRAVLSTSTKRKKINKDAPLGALLTDPISTVLSDNIPEPAVATLLLGSGFGFLVFRRIFNWHPIDNESTEYR